MTAEDLEQLATWHDVEAAKERAWLDAHNAPLNPTLEGGETEEMRVHRQSLAHHVEAASRYRTGYRTATRTASL